MLIEGQHIVSGQEEWQVLELIIQPNHTDRVRVRIVRASEQMREYLNCGQKYVLRQGVSLGDGHYVWAVPENRLKRKTSQVLLWDWPEDKGGPSIEIDTRYDRAHGKVWRIG